MVNPIPDTRPPSKGERLTVRFDEGEIARVRQRSLAMGVAPSALVRAAVLDAVDGGGVPTAIAAAIVLPTCSSQAGTDELRKLRTEVNRLGVNINQVVRRINTEGLAVLASPEAAEQFEEQLGEAAQVLRAVESELGGVRRP